MKKTITKIIYILSLLLFFSAQNQMLADVRTSAQSGLFSLGSTWVGGVAPGPGDDIIIATGHTVTLDVSATVFNIAIQTGAVLDNGTFNLTIDKATPGNPIYSNNGIHDGTGYLVAYDDYNTQISGNGITNCTIEIRSYGLYVPNTCHLTINGNIQHASPGNNGMNNKILIEAWQFGATLTLNGDIITDPVYGGVGIENIAATIIVNGNVSLPGSSSAGSGGVLTNGEFATFTISGNLTLGAYSSYCQNFGSMIIGGDLTGDFDTYFIQEANSSVKFGGSVFPNDDGFLFAVESPILGSSEPNTIEYNGTTAQNIALPTDMAYSNLVVSNTNAIATINTDIAVNGDLTIKPGSALTVNAGVSLSVAGSFTLESDATGTGSFISNAVTSGNVQRYVAGHDGNANAGWHLLSSPVASQAINAFHTPGSGNDFYKWDEPTDTWINRTATGGGLNGAFETNFAIGTGYLIANTATDTKIFNGNFNSSNVSKSGLSYTGSNAHAGWHLLGNPFTSALTWNNGNWALNSVDANAQIWNEANASYSVIEANGIIPEMNGFMVHASQNNASLTIPASARIHNNTNWYKNGQQSERIVLIARDTEGQTAQPTIIRFDTGATEGYDSDYDSYFLAGFAPLFYSISQQENFALNTLPALSEGLSIPFGFIKNGSSEFSIELSETLNGQTVYLTDLKINQTQELNQGNYTFTSQEGDDTNRFMLHFSPLGVNENQSYNNLTAWYFDGQIYVRNMEGQVQVSVFDIHGRRMQNTQFQSSGLNLQTLNLPVGMYIVTLQDHTSFNSVKIFVR